MKKVTNNQRTVNILNKAIANGFEFEELDSLEEIRMAAEYFLMKNEIDVREEKVEIKNLGNHGQRVDWYDGMGFEFWSQGQLTDRSIKGKFIHSTIVDSIGAVVNLYDEL